MKKKNFSWLINLCLAFLLFLVGSVCLYPEKSTLSTGKSQVYRRGTKGISLMFNVYQNTEDLLSILEVLDSYSAKATFFLGGCWADDNEQTVIEIRKRGHEIGNHGYFHLDHASLSYQRNYEEIVACNRYLEAVLKEKVTLFAPPSGAYNEKTIQASVDVGMKVILWSKDTLDWRDHDVNVIYTRATKNIDRGDFVLMHPTKETANALKKILSFYSQEAFSVVTVTENLQIGGSL